MKFQISTTKDEVKVSIEGALDALTVPDLRADLDKLVDNGPPKIEVDLTNLRLIDSSGVGAIVSLYKRIRAKGGKVEIRGLRDQPLAIFRLLRLDRVLLDADGRASLKQQKQVKSGS
jgi:anti-sigma B factor antagonist